MSDWPDRLGVVRSPMGEVRVWDGTSSLERADCHYVRADRIEAQDAELARLREQLAEATAYAKRWAIAQWEKHFREQAPDWKPADDLMTLLMQLDNGSAGLGERLAEAERQRDAARAGALEELTATLELTSSAIRLLVGEMTAQEMRTVKAVLANRVAAIRALIPQPAPTISPAEAVERLAKSLHFDWVDQHGYPNGLLLWVEMPDETGLTADLQAKETWRSMARAIAEEKP